MFRGILCALVLVLVVACSEGPESPAPQSAASQAPYDILFIAVDDLNDWVGHLGGHPQAVTPNIDRLAARGMAFLNAQSPSAVCHSVRTAVLTGLRPSTVVHRGGNGRVRAASAHGRRRDARNLHA
jgi:arylsulfatase A-like enzyme